MVTRTLPSERAPNVDSTFYCCQKRLRHRERNIDVVSTCLHKRCFNVDEWTFSQRCFTKLDQRRWTNVLFTYVPLTSILRPQPCFNVVKITTIQFAFQPCLISTANQRLVVWIFDKGNYCYTCVVQVLLVCLTSFQRWGRFIPWVRPVHVPNIIPF